MTKQQARSAIVVPHQDVLVSDRFNRFVLLVVLNSESVAGRHRFPHLPEDKAAYKVTACPSANPPAGVM
jgi:hypothetical protein